MNLARTNRLNFDSRKTLLSKDTLNTNGPKPIKFCSNACGAKNGFESLRRINIAAAVFHAIFALMILIVGFAGNSPFQIVVTTSLPTVPDPVPAPFNSSICHGKVYEDVFDWFECIRENTEFRKDLIRDAGYVDISENPTSPDAIMPPTKTTYLLTDELQLWTLIFAFSALTALSHSLIAGPIREGYQYWLTRNTQPLRYFEYSITASIMFVIVLALSRVTDLYLLIANALLMCSVNVFGGILEWVTINLPVDYTPKPVTIRVWAWLLSATIFIFQFWQLWDIYLQTIEPFFDENNDTKDLMQQLFGFVTILNTVILICFLTFPIVNAVQFLYFTNNSCRSCMKRNGQNDLYNYIRFEAAYIFCSFFAKGALVLIVFAAAVRRE